MAGSQVSLVRSNREYGACSGWKDNQRACKGMGRNQLDFCTDVQCCVFQVFLQLRCAYKQCGQLHEDRESRHENGKKDLMEKVHLNAENT